MPIDPGPHSLSERLPILAPDGQATLKAWGPHFYEELDREFSGFQGHLLIQRGSFDEAWGMWEMHPKGDEFVYLIEGDVTFRMKAPNEASRSLRVAQVGSYVMVPRGVWHTVEPHVHSTLLFVTPGEGTRNEPEPPDR